MLPEVLDGFHPLYYVGDRSTQLGRPYIDYIFAFPCCILGFSMLNVLSRLVKKHVK